MLDVQQVKIDPIVERNRVSVGSGLPVTRDAWFDEKALFLVIVVSGDFFRQGRSGPHYRDIPFQDVPELRKFIEAKFSNHFPSSQYARIVFDLKNGSSLFVKVSKFFKTVFCISAHRSELVHFERLSIFPDSFLDKNGAAFAIVDFDDNRQKKVKPPK